MWTWLKIDHRIGEVPDGAIVIKEQYSQKTSIKEADEWTVMVRDSTAAWDGWYWADLVPTVSTTSVLQTQKCLEAQYPSAGTGQYCLNCHGSAAAGKNTYATSQFVHTLFISALTSITNPEDNIHYRISHQVRQLSTASDKSCMIPESSDHVVAESKASGVHKFVTSDQCTGCHNATGTLTPSRKDLPSMLFYKNDTPDNVQTVNLSPNGEWRFSMMGLAGRDPVFFSQLNSEVTLHDNLKNQEGHSKEFVQDLCLRCHGVMGQRQFHLDNVGDYFTRNHMTDPDSQYGSLARDGISCAVCHRISADGLKTPDVYTGQFNLVPGDQMNGPFDHPLTLPMKNSLGVQPQYGSQINDSALCGSCHTIILPVYAASGQPILDSATGKQKTFTEQATFFEWQNSDFKDGGSAAQSCQECHMPKTYVDKGIPNPLRYKVANIEDRTFPAVENRAPDGELALEIRDYRRHMLLGINVFALEMFKQFRNELGLYKDDPMLRPSLNTDKGIDTAIDMSSNMIAKTKTADVEILTVDRYNGAWRIDVRVTNKAGHNFPSGVGFRRAFINLQVLNRNGDLVWASGNVATADGSQTYKGAIVDGAGKVLTTELFTPTQQAFQPHYWALNPITRQDQVQIYEELVRNPEGYLSTSFISLDKKVKDNRLQPKGRENDGPNAAETAPVGTCVVESLIPISLCDPQYKDGSGSNVVRYLVPLLPQISDGLEVRATLYYQAIPPYYQQQRATDAAGVDTDRLQRFARDLNVNGTAISNWALPISSARVERYSVR